MKKTMDMTNGNVLSILVWFSLPLMLGDLFQQLYIATDSAMIGRFTGAAALAAVGSSTFLIRLIVGLFVGISTGASVVIAQCVGASDQDKTTRSIHTIAALTLIGGVMLTILGILAAQPLLNLVSTPQDVMKDARIYLQIYFAGSLFNLIYNVGSGILRSFGDSKRPFFYLVASSIINVILDFLFIAILKMGTAGAALATILAQFTSAAMVLYSLTHTSESYRLILRNIHIDRKLSPEILKMGLPAGIQNSIVALSNVIIQSNVNILGTAAMAGFGVFNKVDGIIMLPLSSIAMALTVFAGQNYGAGKNRRILDGIKATIVLNMISWGLGLLICVFFGRSIFSMFTNDNSVINYAVMSMKYLMPCYWGLGIGYALTCMIRGMGRSREASLLFVVPMCILRLCWIFALKQLGIVGMPVVLSAYTFSWVMTLAGSIAYVVYLAHAGEFREVEGTR